MNKTLFCLCFLSVVFFGAGCSSATSKTVIAPPALAETVGTPLTKMPYQPEPIPAGGKMVTWCGEFEAKTSPALMQRWKEGGLWLSSEMFNGMYHEPAIRHVCRGDREVLTLQSGRFVTGDQKFAYPLTASSREPQVVLLDEENARHPGQVWMDMDGAIYVFYESRGEVRVIFDE